MAGIKVSPPPMMVRIVDDKGFPTKELKEYLYRLWARTSDPAGNLLDNANSTADSAEQKAEQSIVLSGNASEQLRQLSAIISALQFLTEDHIDANTAHNSNGSIIGRNDLATTSIQGLVKKAEIIEAPVQTTATTTATVIDVAPAAYNQTHYQTVVTLLNNRTTQLNTLINSHNTLVAKLEEMRQAMITAGMM